RISLSGELPLNTQGGQLSGGRLHGVGMLHEACVQLWGQAGERQVASEPAVAAVAAGGGPVAGCMLLTRNGGEATVSTDQIVHRTDGTVAVITQPSRGRRRPAVGRGPHAP